MNSHQKTTDWHYQQCYNITDDDNNTNTSSIILQDNHVDVKVYIC